MSLGIFMAYGWLIFLVLVFVAWVLTVPFKIWDFLTSPWERQDLKEKLKAINWKRELINVLAIVGGFTIMAILFPSIFQPR